MKDEGSAGFLEFKDEGRRRLEPLRTLREMRALKLLALGAAGWFQGFSLFGNIVGVGFHFSTLLQLCMNL
jgi:hypothetical protein